MLHMIVASTECTQCSMSHKMGALFIELSGLVQPTWAGMKIDLLPASTTHVHVLVQVHLPCTCT